jgi:hypothetical protein
VWWAGSKVHDLYLGTRRLAVCQGMQNLLMQGTADLDASFSTLAGWLADTRTALRLRVWLSGGLCRPFLLPAVAGLSRGEELSRAAGAMASERCGLPGPCRVWRASSPRPSPEAGEVAVAVQEALLQRLEEAVYQAGRKHRIMSLRPWWSDLLRQALQRDPALPMLAVRDCDALTLLAGTGNHFDMATTFSPVIDDDAAQAALARATLTASVAAEAVLRATLRLQPPGSATQAASQPPTAMPPLACLTQWSA